MPESTPQPSAAPTDRKPRTQQQRRESTRRKLLDATIEGLIDVGFANLTTPQICARAGVSQGALFKHFPTKAALMSAAAEHLFACLIDDFREQFQAVDASDDPVGAAMDALWRVFCLPRLHASFDLYTAARTDPGLARDLDPVLQQHFGNITVVAASLFPETARTQPHFLALVLGAVYAMQGAALGGLASNNAAAVHQLLTSFKALARTHLIAPADQARIRS